MCNILIGPNKSCYILFGRTFGFLKTELTTGIWKKTNSLFKKNPVI